MTTIKMNDSSLNWMFRRMKDEKDEKEKEIEHKNTHENGSESCSEKRLKMHTTKIDD